MQTDGTLSSLVASFKTLLTSVSSSFLFGFFSIFRYRLICETHSGSAFDDLSAVWLCVYFLCACVYLFSEQYGGVAVLLAGLGAQSDEPEQEQGQTGAPDHQLPVIVTLQEGFMDVQQLEEERQVLNFVTSCLRRPSFLMNLNPPCVEFESI